MGDRCGVPVTSGAPGGTRFVTGCPKAAVAGGMCREHLDAHRYQEREFDRMMANASQHRRGIVFHGKGVECLCGVFVRDGEDHPWDVPVSVEDALRSATQEGKPS